MSAPAASDATLKPPPSRLGEYEIIAEIAKGGMGSVYLARRAGEAGFQRLFAVKAMHPHLAEDHAFVDMLWDEARIAARLHHQNVVPVLDVGTHDGIPYVVMEYIDGCSLAALLARNKQSRPPEVLTAIFIDALEGLHAAHTLVDDDGQPLHLVHRDVTPQNILIGVDGAARLIDFGIAKAEARVTTTRPGSLKGKFAYMAPEQLIGDGENVDHRVDIFAAGALLFTSLTGQRLFRGESDGSTVHNVLHKPVLAPSKAGLHPPEAFDAVVLRALERNVAKRFQTAREMADALRKAAGAPATRAEVADWVMTSFRAELESRRQAIRAAAQASPKSLRVAVPALPQLAGPPSITSESWPAPAQESSTPAQSASQTRSSLAPHAEATHAGITSPQAKRIRLVFAAGVPLVALLVFVLLLLVKHRSNASEATKPAESATSVQANAPLPQASEVQAQPTPEPSASEVLPVKSVDALPRERVRREPDRVSAKPKTEKPGATSATTSEPTPPAKSPAKPDVQFEKNPYLRAQ